MRFNLRFFFTITILLISALTLSAKVDSIHISINNPKCFAGTDGYVTIDSISTSAPTGPYLIRINTTPVQFPNIGDTISLRNGNFTITVFDIGDGNTPSFRSFSIVEPFQLVTATIYSPPSCYGNCDGYADIFAFDGTPPYTYQWSNTLAQTTTRATGLCVQKYYVTVTDANGCIAIDSVDISQPSQIQPNVTLVDVACFGDSTGSATISPTGGTGTYTSYAWSSSSNTTTTENNLAPGNYTVTVTDSDGCSNTENFTIRQPAAPLSSTLSKIDVDCFGGSSGSINNTPSGGNSPYTYLWNDAATTRNRSNLKVGTYIVTITDSNNCMFIDSITINQPVQINNVFNTTNVLCNGDSSGSITASANNGVPNYSYQWSNGTAGAINNNIPAGKYYVTITDAAFCTKIDSTIISEPDTLKPNLTTTNSSCSNVNNGSATAVPSGGRSPYTYQWSIAGSSSSISNLSPGSYSLTVTDANGCDTVQTFTINNDIVTFTYNDSLKNNDCFGDCTGTIDIRNLSGGTAPYSYQWSANAGNVGNTPSISGLCAGTYFLTISDANGCDSITNFVISAPSRLNSTMRNSNESCIPGNDGSASVIASGGTAPYSYSWSNSQTNDSITGLTAGKYVVTITDKNGCTIKDSTTVTGNVSLTFVDSLEHNNCFGDCLGKIQIIGLSGGKAPYTYQWSNSAGNTNSIDSLCSGSYSLTITDANACDTIVTFNILEPTILSNTTSQLNESCIGNDGSIVAKPSGGTPPYTYNWSNNQNADSIYGLAAGSYYVTITDSLGCMLIDTAIVGVNYATPFSFIDSIDQNACFGDCLGKIEILNIDGGKAPYVFQWSNGAGNTTAIDSLCTGTYTLTITDANGCDSTMIFNITEPTQLTTNSTSTIESCARNDGTAATSVSGGTPPYTYNWSSSQNTDSINGLTAGSYYVTITDSLGCVLIDTVLINREPAIIPNETTNNVTCSGS